MRKNLLEFLFGTPMVERKLDDPKLGDRIVKMFEEADELEKYDMAASKKPLQTALSSLGVTAKIETCPNWCEVRFDDGNAYREAFLAIFTPEGLHDLAEAGWVPAKCGDDAMSNEPACFKIGFFEIEVAGEDMSDTKKAPALKGIMKDGREIDTTETEHDDLNPIENPDKERGGKTTGIGKAKDGSDPEGTPKGSKKNESLSEGGHKAGCQCGFCKNKGSFGKKKKDQDGDDKAKKEADEPTEEMSAEQIAANLLEMTSVGSIPSVGEPMMGTGSAEDRDRRARDHKNAGKPKSRLDKLKARRPDLRQKGFFKE